jgi:2-phosphosulfolactate phosphatase
MNKLRKMKIVVDVFRTSSTIIVALASGVKRIFPLRDISEALKIKKKYILVGEYKQRKIEGFDFNNSPFELLTSDLNGKTLAMLTTNGTKAIIEAGPCYIGGFLNIREVVKLKATPFPVGRLGEPAIEDDLCAAAILLERCNIKPDYDIIKKRILESGKKISKKDFDICMDIDRFDVLPYFDGSKIVDLNRESY